MSLTFDPSMADDEPAVLGAGLGPVATPPDIDRLVAVIADRLSSGLGISDLVMLLQFVPPIELKHKADALAADAAALVVTGTEGVEAADVLVAKIGDVLDEIDAGFQKPTSLANQLHKRMTGLRTEFRKAADEQLKPLVTRLRAENQRLQDVSAAALKAAQDAADKLARKEAKQVVQEAIDAGQPKEVVRELREIAKTTTAPPVTSPVLTPRRTGTTDVDKWKAKFLGTVGDPNPEMDALDPNQQLLVRDLMRQTADGVHGTKLVYFKIDWANINRDAHAQKTTFRCPTLTAFNEGITKRAPRRDK